MNKRDKSNADFLRSALTPLNEKTALPDELSAENITALVSGETQKKNKKGKIEIEFYDNDSLNKIVGLLKKG